MKRQTILRTAAALGAACLVFFILAFGLGWHLLLSAALSIGVYAGRMRLLAGQRPAAGLLLGTRRAVFSRPGWPVGTRFTAHAAKTWEGDDGLWQFDCSVEADAPGEAPEPAARAVLTVFNPPENFFERARAASARPASQGES